MDVSKIVVPPNHPLKNRVFHEINHPFWGCSPYFWKHPPWQPCVPGSARFFTSSNFDSKVVPQTSARVPQLARLWNRQPFKAQNCVDSVQHIYICCIYLKYLYIYQSLSIYLNIVLHIDLYQSMYSKAGVFATWKKQIKSSYQLKQPKFGPKTAFLWNQSLGLPLRPTKLT